VVEIEGGFLGEGEVVRKIEKKGPTTPRFHAASLAVGWDGSMGKVVGL
jgi:hypothetical protein